MAVERTGSFENDRPSDPLDRAEDRFLRNEKKRGKEVLDTASRFLT